MKRAGLALTRVVWKPVLAAVLLAGFCSASLAMFDAGQANGDIYDAAGMFVQTSILMPAPKKLRAARSMQAGD